MFKTTWKELSENELAEVLNNQSFGDDIYRIANNEEKTITEATDSFIERNPSYEQILNKAVKIIFGQS